MQAAARPRRLSIILAAIALLVAACGGSGDSAPRGTEAVRFDSARAMDHVRKLSEDIGIRAAGTDGERQAAEYIRDELASYGYDTSFQAFTFESYEDLGSVVQVAAPESRDIDAQALAPSITGSAEGALVDAGRGRQAEFPAGSAGKIALVQRGDITFREKAENAAAAGASAIIVYNNEPGPFHANMREAVDIPAATVSLQDGDALLALMIAGPVAVRVSVEGRTVTADSQNVVAEPPDGACRVIAGGHYDSVPEGPGANDNASGTATVLEMARVVAATDQADEVCFVLFGAEELGLLGSRHYVSALSEDDLGALEAMLNFDMLSVGNGWPLVGSGEIVNIASQVAEGLGLPHERGELPQGAGSDHAPFIEAGVPAVLFNCFCDPNYHTDRDQAEFIDAERMGEAGAMGRGIIDELLAE